MNPTILLPELPDTTDPKAVKEYLSAHQKILADKQKDDFEALTGAKGLIFPVGTWYTQYPSAKSNDEAVAFPESEEPANKFGGVWTEPFAGESVYFRTNGTLANNERADGKQLDAMQRITGNISAITNKKFPNFSLSGVFFSSGATTDKVLAATGNEYAGQAYWNFDSKNSLSPNTAKTNNVESRVLGYLIKVWYRES